MKIVSKIGKVYINLRGFHTNRKIIIFESDDWGSIRMPNSGIYNKLVTKIPRIKEDRFSKYDSIASVHDLELLFELLLNFKDKNGNNPIITANTIVANPDFKKIVDNNFEKYEFETFDNTIKKLPDGKKILSLWSKGINEKIFMPQLHGREHLNVPFWLNEIKSGNYDLLEAFNEGCFGIPFSPTISSKRNNVMAALDCLGLDGEKKFQTRSIIEASKIFENYFGFKSISFIAPAYIWDSHIEKVLKEVNIKILQGLPFQYIPNKNNTKYDRKLHYIGEKNKFDQYYITRNAFFEPLASKKIDSVDLALSKIEYAFKFNKPAIIGTHRINFIGSLIEENRDQNLLNFKLLIKTILKKWPDVEFLSTDKLINLLEKKY